MQTRLTKVTHQSIMLNRVNMLNIIDKGAAIMLGIRLSDETEQRLEALAKATGRTKSYYAREAIEVHLDTLEDIYLSERALENLKRGTDQVLDSDEFWHDLDN